MYFMDIWLILWTFGISTKIWCNLRTFGKFCGNLVYFFPFWCVVPRKIWQPCVEPNSLETKWRLKKFRDCLTNISGWKYRKFQLTWQLRDRCYHFEKMAKNILVVHDKMLIVLLIFNKMPFFPLKLPKTAENSDYV
jgi:hypothetical protein